MHKHPAPSLPPWLAPEVPFERYLLDVGDGLQMHVMEQGTGRPVLLLHGNPTWGFLYRKVARELTGQNFRVIMPDLIGLGFSDKPRDAAIHQLSNHSRWLGAAIDQLDLRDAIFVGQDWGGPIGIHAFAARPDRLSGMVILNTVVGAPREGFNPAAFHRFAATPGVSDFAFRVLNLPTRALHMAQGDKSSIRGEVARAYRYPLRRFADRIAPLALARMAPVDLNHPSIPALRECEDFVSSFKGPVHMVWGRRDPVLARALKRTRALLGNPPVTETQAGHFLQEEVPEDIARAITKVSAQIDRSPHVEVDQRPS